jgi:hypothetical protein
MMRLKLQIHDHCTWSDTIDPSTLSTWWWVVKLGHVLRKAKMHKGRSCSVPLELWVRPSREALYQKEMQQQAWGIGLCHTVQKAILARWHLLRDVLSSATDDMNCSVSESFCLTWRFYEHFFPWAHQLFWKQFTYLLILQ